MNFFYSLLSVSRLQLYSADGYHGACLLCKLWVSDYKFLCCFQVNVCQFQYDLCIYLCVFIVSNHFDTIYSQPLPCCVVFFIVLGKGFKQICIWCQRQNWCMCACHVMQRTTFNHEFVFLCRKTLFGFLYQKTWCNNFLSPELVGCAVNGYTTCSFFAFLLKPLKAFLLPPLVNTCTIAKKNPPGPALTKHTCCYQSSPNETVLQCFICTPAYLPHALCAF